MKREFTKTLFHFFCQIRNLLHNEPIIIKIGPGKKMNSLQTKIVWKIFKRSKKNGKNSPFHFAHHLWGILCKVLQFCEHLVGVMGMSILKYWNGSGRQQQQYSNSPSTEQLQCLCVLYPFLPEYTKFQRLFSRFVSASKIKKNLHEQTYINII